MNDYEQGLAEGRREIEHRMADAAAKLSDAAHHKIMRELGSAHPCPVADCRLSAEEHHRIAYGILAENKELRRRVEALEHQRKDHNA